MARVLVVTWAGEVGQRMADAFDEAGHDVLTAPPEDSAVDEAKTHLPDVIVMDLGDQPGHGREVARTLQRTKATRDLPLVLYGVDAANEVRIRTAAPRGRLIPERTPAAVLATVRAVLGLRATDDDDGEDVIDAVAPPVPVRKSAARRPAKG